jgi:hypothetical protein
METMRNDNQTQPLFNIYNLDWDHDDDNDLVTKIQVTRAQLIPYLRGSAMTHNIFQNETSATIQVRCCLDHEALAPYACVSVVTSTDKVYFSDYRGHDQLFKALFGTEDPKRFAYEFAQEHALEWSDLPDFDGCYPVSIEEIRFPILVTNPPKGVTEQRKAVLDPSDKGHTEVSIAIAPWGHTITITTPEGEWNSYKNPEKMPQFFGADWREELGYLAENL